MLSPEESVNGPDHDENDDEYLYDDDEELYIGYLGSGDIHLLEGGAPLCGADATGMSFGVSVAECRLLAEGGQDVCHICTGVASSDVVDLVALAFSQVGASCCGSSRSLPPLPLGIFLCSPH